MSNAFCEDHAGDYLLVVISMSFASYQVILLYAPFFLPVQFLSFSHVFSLYLYTLLNLINPSY